MIYKICENLHYLREIMAILSKLDIRPIIFLVVCELSSFGFSFKSQKKLWESNLLNTSNSDILTGLNIYSKNENFLIESTEKFIYENEISNYIVLLERNLETNILKTYILYEKDDVLFACNLSLKDKKILKSIIRQKNHRLRELYNDKKANYYFNLGDGGTDESYYYIFQKFGTEDKAFAYYGLNLGINNTYKKREELLKNITSAYDLIKYFLTL